MGEINIESADIYIGDEKIGESKEFTLNYKDEGPKSAQATIDKGRFDKCGNIKMDFESKVDTKYIEEIIADTLNSMETNNLLLQLSLIYDVSYYKLFHLSKLVKNNAELVEVVGKLEYMSFDELRKQLKVEKLFRDDK